MKSGKIGKKWNSLHEKKRLSTGRDLKGVPVLPGKEAVVAIPALRRCKEKGEGSARLRTWRRERKGSRREKKEDLSSLGPSSEEI